ncbi:uncharacterized protein LOC124263417 isoform X2 [Haliotis rubra]|uniref:uncharacterized protein LOC124263417 isoform X2 n=1 Tax=Haliotis rubra TaxID=36100 RepID=UPI001EE58AA9|nr:uncharacterized protein LOC124263417 isoform X2 [Haliotis rubra]
MMLLSSRVMFCALMAQWGGCYIQLHIHPKTIHLDSSRHHVTIRCSLDLTRSRTQKVYSIMLKKGGSTVAVLFQDKILHNMTNRHYDVTGSVTTTSSSVAFFQIVLDNVTCLDRGDYSCIMAVKRLGKATSMEPVTSRLEIQGPSATTASTAPPTHTTTSSRDTSPPERDGRRVLTTYVLVSAFAVVLIVTLICLLFSDPKCKCHPRTLKNSNVPRDTFRSERHRRRRRVMIVQSGNLTCPPPGLDRASDETGYREGYLQPQDTADNSVSESNEHVYEEIE